MSATNVHIINHTHWDREWFLTSVYTSRWIPGLIDKLQTLADANPDFRFLFDGQTLVIEDLLEIAPSYEEKIRELVGGGRLQIGPYYCQPDWQLTGGELLIRNLLYGQQDVARFGGTAHTGWMVDTFGHISQSPQIHQLFGIEALFVWRGVPELEPYFIWQGADGSQLLTINLFGGYRNLYGVSHAPEVAVKRLESEVDKLLPFYPTPDMPLFDGYDLENSPEDPRRFYASLGNVRPDIVLLESTPEQFSALISSKDLPLPRIQGELNSGKYGATFPGVFSARTYLKIMAHDCERMLFKICEPLGLMAHLHGRPYAAGQYEHWGRSLLQNSVHDCICAVSIDQVHEKMEYSYKQAFAGMQADASASLAVLFENFTAGTYAVSSNPFAQDAWIKADDALIHVQTDGVGIWPAAEQIPVQKTAAETDHFIWTNDHYEAKITADGLINVADGVYGELIVSTEHGDTYSEEIGERLGQMQASSRLMLEETSDHHAVLSFAAHWQGSDVQVAADVRLILDESPLIKWEIDLDSRGKDFRVEMVFETAVSGTISAGMPFDNVSRPVTDTDLLPHDLPTELSPVLLGQRELNSVSMFPFHDYVGVQDGESAVTVLAKGIRGYRAEAEGVLIVPLRRSVEWLTEAGLKDRLGDAGPFFYVPDARCERVVKHELAVAVGLDGIDSISFQAANAAYQNPAIVVDVKGNGSRTSFSLLQEDVPLAALFVHNGQPTARFYNPGPQERPFSKTYTAVDVYGEQIKESESIGAKKIQSLNLDLQPAADKEVPDESSTLINATLPQWRVGENQGRPDESIMARLAADAAAMDVEIADLEEKLSKAEGSEKLLIQHRIYVLKRESLEFQLSHLLNERKLAQDGALNREYLYEPDAEISKLGLALNKQRIKRRIFDYVVEAVK